MHSIGSCDGAAARSGRTTERIGQRVRHRLAGQRASRSNAASRHWCNRVPAAVPAGCPLNGASWPARLPRLPPGRLAAAHPESCCSFDQRQADVEPAGKIVSSAWAVASAADAPRRERDRPSAPMAAITPARTRRPRPPVGQYARDRLSLSLPANACLRPGAVRRSIAFSMPPESCAPAGLAGEMRLRQPNTAASVRMINRGHP